MQPRYTEREVVIAGVRIPADSVLLYGNGPANHDPAEFEEPEAFRLDRPPRKLASFGGGPHVCLGMHLARAELQVSLGLLLERLPGLRLRNRDTIGPVGAVLRGVRSLPVVYDDVLPAAGKGAA